MTLSSQGSTNIRMDTLSYTQTKVFTREAHLVSRTILKTVYGVKDSFERGSCTFFESV